MIAAQRYASGGLVTGKHAEKLRDLMVQPHQQTLAELSEVTALAYRIADETARSDIELYCTAVQDDGSECTHLPGWHGWHDLDAVRSGHEEWILRARRYLSLRGARTADDREAGFVVTYNAQRRTLINFRSVQP